MKNLIWFVGYKINKDASHGIKESYNTIASFATAQNAEDFIIKCMPDETKSRFYIETEKCRFYPVTHIFEEL